MPLHRVLFLAGLAGWLAAAGCGRPARLDAPAEPTSPAPRAESSGREPLAAICLATPWAATDAERGPQPIALEHRERLAALESDCRDVHPELPPARFASTSDIPASECHYGIARIYFELGHHPEAARWFHRVIARDEDVELGAFAAQMYLDSLDALARHGSPPRTECRRLAREDAARFVRLYCARPETQDQCPIFRRAAAEPAQER